MVLFVGNLYESKGTVSLIEATGELVRRGVPVRVVLAGADPDGGTIERLQALAEACGAGRHVDIVGPRYGLEKDRLYAEARIFCFPTAYEAEGMPLVVLEAMAHGLPVLSTRWRAIPALVENGVTGVLVDPGDTSALADALAGLLADPRASESMGQRGRERYLDRFTTDSFLQHFEQLVLQAATGSGREAAPTSDGYRADHGRLDDPVV
jgi:glycosyltransferase involved in cell wall biosynthesis